MILPLYRSCFDANGGLFETRLGAEDAVISDELNHARILDGIRLCKAQRFRYKNNDMVEYLRQRSRPDLFSNSVAPVIAAGSVAALDLLSRSTELRDTLAANTQYFRNALTEQGFAITPGTHPITPIMLKDAALAAKFAEAMLAKGVYVVGFSYPVVPLGKARIRTQVSAAHTRADLEFAVKCFAEVQRELGIRTELRG